MQIARGQVGVLLLFLAVSTPTAHILGVNATGRKLFISVNIGFFGTGIISAVFHVVGELLCLRERLKRVVKIPTSSYQQLLKTFPHILSGPLALCTFSPLKPVIHNKVGYLCGNCLDMCMFCLISMRKE